MEILKGIFRRPKNPTEVKENTAIVSSFVLIQDGEERYLNVSERVTLNPGKPNPGKPNPEDKQEVESFEVICSPNPNMLELEITWKNPFAKVRSGWGLRKSALQNDGSSKPDELMTGLMQIRDGSRNIKGSGLFFSKKLTDLHGDGWTIKYSPQLPNANGQAMK